MPEHFRFSRICAVLTAICLCTVFGIALIRKTAVKPSSSEQTPNSRAAHAVSPGVPAENCLNVVYDGEKITVTDASGNRIFSGKPGKSLPLSERELEALSGNGIVVTDEKQIDAIMSFLDELSRHPIG